MLNDDIKPVCNPFVWETLKQEEAFRELESAIKLGMIAGFSVNRIYTPDNLALKVFSFSVYEEPFEKLKAKGEDGFGL